MDFDALVSARRSTREFTSDAVDREVLERVIRAAALAPSSRNEQPWRFYVTQNEARVALASVVAQTTVYLKEYMDVLGPEGYAEAVRWYSSLGDAPVLIAVAAPDSDDEFMLVNRLLSVGAAMENLLLAAANEGLGACPITFSYWVKDEVSALLEVPEGESVVSIVVVGWPAPRLGAAPEKRADVAVWQGFRA